MDLSVMDLVKKTFPFIITRILVYLLFGVVAFVFLGVMVGIGFLIYKLFGESGGAFILIFIITLLAIFAGLKFVERYVLYLVKMGHVSVIVELIRKGELPEGKGMVEYGKDKVKENFGSSSAAFALDAAIHAAVRQIQRWMMRISDFFRFIPGSQYVFAIISAIMSISLNYIDEAIMSYVFLQKSEKKEDNLWKSASDGIVLYAQSWKSILKSAAISVLFIYVLSIIVFLIFVFPLMFIGKLIAGGTAGLGTFLGFLAVIGALVITLVIKRALVDPIVTIIMVRSYQISIRTLTSTVDLQEKLIKISPRFKRLFNKAQEEENSAPPGATPAEG